MDAVSFGDLAAASAMITGGLALILGVPTFIVARHALRAEAKADRLQETAEVVREVMVGKETPPPRDRDHPSMLDLMDQLAGQQLDVDWLVAVISWHLRDGHGGQIPARLTSPRPRR